MHANIILSVPPEVNTPHDSLLPLNNDNVILITSASNFLVKTKISECNRLVNLNILYIFNCKLHIFSSP